MGDTKTSTYTEEYVRRKSIVCMSRYIRKNTINFTAEDINELATAAVDAGYSLFTYGNGEETLLTNMEFGMDRNRIKENQESILAGFRAVFTNVYRDILNSKKALKFVADMMCYCNRLINAKSMALRRVNGTMLAARLLNDGLYVEATAETYKYRLRNANVSGDTIVNDNVAEVIAHIIDQESEDFAQHIENFMWYIYLNKTYRKELTSCTGSISRVISVITESVNYIVQLPQVGGLRDAPEQDRYVFNINRPLLLGGTAASWVGGRKIDSIVKRAFEQCSQSEEKTVAVDPSPVEEPVTEDHSHAVNVKWTDDHTEVFSVDRAEYVGNILMLTLTSGEKVHIASDKILYWTSPIGGLANADLD